MGKKEGFNKAIVFNKKEIPGWAYATFGVVMALVFLVCALYLSFNIVYEYFPISGVSMQPTINMDTEDGAYINKFKKGSYGDIIVYKTPPGSRENVIKRIIAMGGDKIAVINDQNTYYLSIIKKGSSIPVRLEENYLSEYNKSEGMRSTFYNLYDSSTLFAGSKIFEEIDGIKYLLVPEDHVFYLGDNRRVSSDCSIYGAQPTSGIIGTAEILIKNRENFFGQVMTFFGQKLCSLF